jgi:hypothetical protein
MIKNAPLFWILLSVVLYPLLFAGFLLFVIMPPLNMVLVPLWFFVGAGAVGGVTNGLDEARRVQALQREARRYAPGVVLFQRTNAR